MMKYELICLCTENNKKHLLLPHNPHWIWWLWCGSTTLSTCDDSFVPYMFSIPISAALTLTLSRSRITSPYSSLLWYLSSDSSKEFVSSILVTLAERNVDAMIWKILYFPLLQESSQTLCLLFWQRLQQQYAEMLMSSALPIAGTSWSLMGRARMREKPGRDRERILS